MSLIKDLQDRLLDAVDATQFCDNTAHEADVEKYSLKFVIKQHLKGFEKELKETLKEMECVIW
jgi:hypothetical protein